MPFSTRPAKPEDAGSACAAVRLSIEECCDEDHRCNPDRLDAWLKNKTPENFLAWIQNDSVHCVVVEKERTVVGFAMASRDELLLCYVIPEVLYQGAGKALLRSIEKWVATSGTGTLHLESTRTASAFYRRNGFENVGPVAVFAGMDGYPMCKRMMANPTFQRTALPPLN